MAGQGVGHGRYGVVRVQRDPESDAIAPAAVVVMGVSGSGKSTLAPLLAKSLGCRFIEGDEHHDAANVAKMRAGQPLHDEDRWPWLDRLGAALREAIEADGIAVAACSALKHSYRDRLARAVGFPASFILLECDQAELTRRLVSRPGHYMPASLLASQLATLERPGGDERALTLDAHLPPAELCTASREWLGRSS